MKKPSEWGQTLAIFKKEAMDHLRDHRSIGSAMLTTLFLPVFLVVMIMVVGRTVMRDMVDKPLDLPVVGAEYAPGLIAYLTENNVNVLPPPADPLAAVREGDEDVVLVILPEYGEAFTSGRPAPIQMIFDSTRTSSTPTIERTRIMLSGYASTIASLRLYARGVDPRLLQPLSIERVNVSTPQSNALIFLNMLPFMIIMTIFLGGMYVIIDATAGERERGSLEPLLINPAPRRVFVLGKLLASLPFAIAMLALALFLFWVGFNVVPLENYTGMRMNIDGGVLFNIFWLSLPVVLLASVMQMVVASFTRSFKEAQTYLSFLPLIAGLPGAFLSFVPVKNSLYIALIPIFGQSVLMNQLMRGETINPWIVIAGAAMTLLFSALLAVVAVKLFERESLLFGAK